MRTKLIAGNWKMHGSKSFIESLMNGITGQLSAEMESDVLVCPPAIYIPLVKDLISEQSIAVGAQDISEQEQGAYTGEISGDMLKDNGCQYVIVGHSERRSLYGETDLLVAHKVGKAIEFGLTPILCVGETLEQREKGSTMQVVQQQLDAVIDTLGIDAFAKIVVAYEPVWAIGTGVTASPDQAQDVHSAIRTHLRDKNAQVAESIKILYGGSMKAANAEELLAQPDIDGGLIGGASLKADEFIAICNIAG